MRMATATTMHFAAVVWIANQSERRAPSFLRLSHALGAVVPVSASTESFLAARSDMGSCSQVAGAPRAPARNSFRRASRGEATLVRVILQKGFLRREFENVSP